jgi:hypothetical protein
MLKVKRLGSILTEEEKWFVIQLARIEGGLSQASLIRRLIRKAASAHGFERSVSSLSDVHLEASHDQQYSVQFASINPKNNPKKGDIK